MLRMLLKVGTAFVLLGTAALMAQESEQADEEEAATEETSGPVIGSDDADLDLQSYEDDDDDFVPTEEIPADQAIPFPSDI